MFIGAYGYMPRVACMIENKLDADQAWGQFVFG